MSVRDLHGPRRWVAFALCCAWFAFTVFPLYWVAITSLKTPPDVVGGPTYLPFVDFQPTLKAWRELLSGIRGEFYSNFWSSTIVAVSSSVLATLLGAMAAYALVRFPFRVKLLSGILFFAVAMGASCWAETWWACRLPPPPSSPSAWRWRCRCWPTASRCRAR